MAKCPHCDADVKHMHIKSVDLTNDKHNKWTGLSYSCPECDRILSVGFDPIALNVELRKAVAESVVTALRSS
jgi:hypothetical protein